MRAATGCQPERAWNNDSTVMSLSPLGASPSRHSRATARSCPKVRKQSDLVDLAGERRTANGQEDKRERSRAGADYTCLGMHPLGYSRRTMPSGAAGAIQRMRLAGALRCRHEPDGHSWHAMSGYFERAPRSAQLCDRLSHHLHRSSLRKERCP